MEEFKRMTPEEYRAFSSWVGTHGQEMYKNKIAYECMWGKDEYFYVRLCDESLFTLDDIMLDIDKEIVYHVQHDDE
jgi:hypothetical protein|tara:strand:- start:6315 stop:6542 length:228 start_codon:yes stop_codon:yes gene_type:complete